MICRAQRYLYSGEGLSNMNSLRLSPSASHRALREDHLWLYQNSVTSLAVSPIGSGRGYCRRTAVGMYALGIDITYLKNNHLECYFTNSKTKVLPMVRA